MTKTFEAVQAAAKEALDGRAELEPQLREPEAGAQALPVPVVTPPPVDVAPHVAELAMRLARAMLLDSESPLEGQRIEYGKNMAQAITEIANANHWNVLALEKEKAQSELLVPLNRLLAEQNDELRALIEGVRENVLLKINRLDVDIKVDGTGLDLELLVQACEVFADKARSLLKLADMVPPKGTGLVEINHSEVKVQHGDVNDEVLEHYHVEIQDNTEGFAYRLVETETGRASLWGGYAQIVVLDKVAAITGYYSGSTDKELVPLHALDVLKQFGVGEAM